MTKEGALDPTKKPDQMPATLDGQSGELLPTPRKSRIKLPDVEACRRELARVYRMIDQGTLAPEDGSRRAYMLKTVVEILSIGQLAKRLDALERAAAGARR